MLSKKEQDEYKAKRMLALYNMIPNLFWSILHLTPIAVYCYTLLDHPLFYIFLAISCIPVFLPIRLIDYLQCSQSIRWYKKWGVHHINRVAQNGVLINALVKRKYPNHRIVHFQKRSIAGFIRQTYMFEKFHLLLFVFFSLTMIKALLNQQFLWAFVFAINNIAYNIYPNLLQQYIRLKLNQYNAASISRKQPA